jgi:hypothetical protein
MVFFNKANEGQKIGDENGEQNQLLPNNDGAAKAAEEQVRTKY